MKLKTDIVFSHVRRTPFAQIAKALGSYQAYELGLMVAKDIMQKSKIEKKEIDGLLVGEAFPSQPNSARVIGNLLELPDEIPALSLANNCVSSLEAVAEACRRIELEEGQLFLSLGQESLTGMPIIVEGSRNNKKTGSLDKLRKLLPDQLPEGVRLCDTLEEGLGDGETSFGMHVTAEILAQNYGISRERSDSFAYESFKRSYNASTEGKYKKFIFPVKDKKTEEVLEADEAVLLRKGIVENPGRMQKAMLLFENPVMKFEDFKKKYSKSLQKSHAPTVTIFNACPRSDGASGLFVSSAKKAKELALDAQAKVTGFCMKGVQPNLMGLGQAEASLALLEDMGLSMKDIDQIEIHEAFAATAIGALEEIRNRTGFDWEKNFEEGKINAYGGSIAIGHPFGATGIRLIGNAIMNLEQKPETKRVLITACAHGGIAGAMMIERV